jgi:hypothetical protein
MRNNSAELKNNVIAKKSGKRIALRECSDEDNRTTAARRKNAVLIVMIWGVIH